MKIAALIARILLGLVFLVFGLNGFLQFIPADFASRNGRSVLQRAVAIALRLLRKFLSTGGRSAVACEPLRPAGAHPSWPGNRQYPHISFAHGPSGAAPRSRRVDSVGRPGLSSPAVLRRPVRAAHFLSQDCAIMTPTAGPRWWPLALGAVGKNVNTPPPGLFL